MHRYVKRAGRWAKRMCALGLFACALTWNEARRNRVTMRAKKMWRKVRGEVLGEKEQDSEAELTRNDSIGNAREDEADLANTTELSKNANDWDGDWQENFETVTDLTNGTGGVVRLCKRKSTGVLFVVKSVVLEQDWETEEYVDSPEYKILGAKLGQHPNIVQLQFTDVDFDLTNSIAPQRHLFYEYCAGGDLNSFIDRWQRYDRPVPEIFAYHVMSSLCEALAYLHLGARKMSDVDRWAKCPQHTGETVLHRDIKPHNIFLRFPGRNKYGLPDVVLGDFGLAATESENTGIAGTRDYFPPEVSAVWNVRHHDIVVYCEMQTRRFMSAASDIYTTGLSVYKLLTYQFFTKNPDLDLLDNDQHRIGGDGLPYSDRVWAGLRWMLRANFKQRTPSEYLPEYCDTMSEEVDRCWEEGQHMPADSWSDPPEWDGDVPWISRAGSSEHLLAGQAVVDNNDDDGASEQTGVDTIVDFYAEDHLCWCNHHRSISERQWGPGCEGFVAETEEETNQTSVSTHAAGDVPPPPTPESVNDRDGSEVFQDDD